MPYSGPRSVFYYVVSFLTLYLSAIGAAILSVGLADHWFEDPLETYAYASGPIRTGIAMLVVAYPTFLFLNIKMRRRVLSGDLPERSAVKRVLTYITLFVIALTTIIDLITLIYQFLGGELTARFATQGIAILVIAGFVFLYYLGDLRETKDGDAPDRGDEDAGAAPEGEQKEASGAAESGN